MSTPYSHIRLAVAFQWGRLLLDLLISGYWLYVVIELSLSPYTTELRASSEFSVMAIAILIVLVVGTANVLLLIGLRRRTPRIAQYALAYALPPFVGSIITIGQNGISFVLLIPTALSVATWICARK